MSRQQTVGRRKMSKSANAAEVAQFAGVSTSAVYMSLRDDPRMSPDTRAKIRAVAEQLNYRPLAGARALGKGRTDAVGVVFSHPDMQVSSEWFGHYAPALEMISEVLD